MTDMTAADIAAVTRNNGYGYGYGYGMENQWIWVVVLFALFGGGFGWGNRGGNADGNFTRSDLQDGFNTQSVLRGIESLGELTEEEFEKFKSSIKDEINRARAKHAVYENQRTIKAVEALKNNDIKTFGELMNASHVSLRDDYETSCEEVDVLVEEAWKIDGVIGSRITGGGFGGCTVSLVKDEAIDEFKEKLTAAYEEKVGKTPEFYVVSIGDGPSRLI